MRPGASRRRPRAAPRAASRPRQRRAGREVAARRSRRPGDRRGSRELSASGRRSARRAPSCRLTPVAAGRASVAADPEPTAGSSSSWSQMPTIRASARPSASSSTASIGSSTARIGRSSSPTPNFANGNSSFQRSSLRYDLRNMSLMGGAKWAQTMSASDGSRITVTRRSKRRRPSSTRSQEAIPSRSARSRASRPSSASQRSTSAGRTGGAPGSADGMARGV